MSGSVFAAPSLIALEQLRESDVATQQDIARRDKAATKYQEEEMSPSNIDESRWLEVTGDEPVRLLSLALEALELSDKLNKTVISYQEDEMSLSTIGEFRWLEAGNYQKKVPSFALELSEEVLEQAFFKALEAFKEGTCRVVQKWVMEAPSYHGCALACHIDVLAAANNKTANFVVQLLAQILPANYLMILAKVVCDNFHALSRSEYGCRLVQRLFERPDCNILAKYAMELFVSHGLLETLVWHRWGTYVVGVFLEKCSEDDLFHLQGVIYSLLMGCLASFEKDRSVRSNKAMKLGRLNYGSHAVLHVLRTHADLLPELCRNNVHILLKMYHAKRNCRRLT